MARLIQSLAPRISNCHMSTGALAKAKRELTAATLPTAKVNIHTPATMTPTIQEKAAKTPTEVATPLPPEKDKKGLEM